MELCRYRHRFGSTECEILIDAVSGASRRPHYVAWAFVVDDERLTPVYTPSGALLRTTALSAGDALRLTRTLLECTYGPEWPADATPEAPGRPEAPGALR